MEKDMDSSVFGAEAKDTGQPSVEMLIAELEAAQEGSRELDAKIIARLVGGEAAISPANYEWCVYRGVDRQGRPRLWEASIGETWLPRYTHESPTRSLDAAVTLVPEGWDWKVISRRHTPYQGRWSYEAVADRGDLRIPVHQRMISGFARTAPLALCIAALRARQAAPQTTTTAATETPDDR